MSFLFDCIGSIDVRQLEGGEVSQCLLYLDLLAKSDAGIGRRSRPIRKKLQEGLSELREAKKPR